MALRVRTRRVRALACVGVRWRGIAALSMRTCGALALLLTGAVGEDGRLTKQQMPPVDEKLLV